MLSVLELKTTRVAAATKRAAKSPARAKYLFKLYIAGATTRSRRAVQHVQQLCEAEMKDAYELEVIDVYQQPKLVRASQIVVTPTLVRERPHPMRRFVGDLSGVPSLVDA